MKAATLVLGLLLAATSVSAADPPSLLRTWSGHRERIARDDGWRDGTATMVITEQHGLTFEGYLTRTNPTGDVKEELWGAFTPGGQLITAADDEGYYSFDPVDNDTLDYCNAEVGPSPRSVCARLLRQK